MNALLGAISSPVRWSQASLPRALTTEEVQRLEAHCAQTKRAPLRLLAMVRLALDLGLRVGEIAKLEIGDFDWRVGTVTLKRTKSQRQDVLPLPALTGQALAEYMRHERPATMLSSLFVRLFAPHDKPIGVDGVSRAIGRALRSAGISRSCHSLRHTLACRLVNSGSSIKEVADVLLDLIAGHLVDLRQARLATACRGRSALAWECIMSAPSSPSIDITAKVEQYLAERRRLGFKPCSSDLAVRHFTRFMAGEDQRGALTVDVMVQWARQVQPRYLVDGQPNVAYRSAPAGDAAPLHALAAAVRCDRRSSRRLQLRSDPAPRGASHLQRSRDRSADRRGPPTRALGWRSCRHLCDAVRPDRIGRASVSKAINLADTDADLDGGILTIQQTKFGKSRMVPLHPSVIGPLAAYRALRRQHVQPRPQMTFFVSSRGVRRGVDCWSRRCIECSGQLREQLGWIDRGRRRPAPGA